MRPPHGTNAPSFSRWGWLPSHNLSFGLDQFEFLCKHKPLGEPLWKYLASLIYIVLAFYIAKLIDFLANVWLKRLTAKTETELDDLLLEMLHGPVKVVAFVIFLNIGLGIFDWPARAQLYLSRGLIIVVAASVTYVALKFVDLLLGVWRKNIVSPQDKAFAAQLFPFISKVAKTAIIIAAVVLTAENLDIKIKPARGPVRRRPGARPRGAGHGGQPLRRGGDFFGQAVSHRRPHQGRGAWTARWKPSACAARASASLTAIM